MARRGQWALRHGWSPLTERWMLDVHALGLTLLWLLDRREAGSVRWCYGQSPDDCAALLGTQACSHAQLASFLAQWHWMQQQLHGSCCCTLSWAECYVLHSMEGW